MHGHDVVGGCRYGVAMATDGEASAGGQPHDGLFRLVFSDPEHAGSELRSVLPRDLAARIDLDRLVLQEGTFVDEVLRHRQTDVLFSTRVSGRDAYLYVLIEHQSSPDPMMAFRMLTYQVRIWERQLAEHPQRGTRPLPIIVPVVIYQGRRQWSAATDVAGLLDIDDELKAVAGELLPRFAYLLDDLTGVDDTALRMRPLTSAARMTFVLFANAPDDADATRWLVNWVDDLSDIDRRRLAGIFSYLVRVSVTPVDDLVRFAATVGPVAEEVAMTTADQLIAQGEARGIASGRAGLLMDMLTLKFGELDVEVRRRIERATAEQIGEWSARLVQGAETIAAVLGSAG